MTAKRRIHGSVLVVLTLVLIGAAVLVAGCGSNVTWYRVDGMQTVEGKTTLSFKPFSEGQQGPTMDELTQLALKVNPSFFAEAPVGEMVMLKDWPGGEAFLSEAMKSFGSSVGLLVAFEVSGSLPAAP
jgi:hypothetical protein